MAEIENKITIKELPCEIRPRERLFEQGTGSLSDAELLALVIESGINGKNALQLAQEILITFGALNKIPYKYPAELFSVKGIGKAKVGKILAAIEMGKRAYFGSKSVGRKISNPEEAANFLLPELGFLEHEVVKVIILNIKNIVLRMDTVSTGGLSKALVLPRDIFRPALRENGSAVIIAHNHPSGDIQPSQADKEFTERIKQAGKTIGIKLLDHFIIGQGRYISLKRMEIL